MPAYVPLSVLVNSPCVDVYVLVLVHEHVLTTANFCSAAAKSGRVKTAVTGHSLEPFLSESVEAARPGLEQKTQLLRPDSDHDMASASSSRATTPTASRTTTHAQTRGQTRQQQLQQERADTERRLNNLEAANEEMAKCFRETKLSDNEHDERDIVSSVTAQLGSQAGRQSLIESVAEAQ